MRRAGVAVSGLIAVTMVVLTACSPVRQMSDPAGNPGEREPAADGLLAAWLDGSPETTNADASGFRLLVDGDAALEWRVRSLRKASERISVQYFMWRDDVVGRMLLAELLAAAERGVQVEILIDDMHVRGNEALLAPLADHPNIGIRSFNPFHTRAGLLRMGIEFVVRSDPVNHRMHNKSWIVDDRLAIIGGRNIADEYFNAGGAFNFTDLDLAIAGPLAFEVGQSFAEYWRSPAAVPVQKLARFAGDAAQSGALNTDGRERPAGTHLTAVGPHPPANPYERGPLDRGAYVWTSAAELVVDAPAKAYGDGRTEAGVVQALAQRYAQVEEELILISPYFVPGAEGVRMLGELSRQGVDVGVLTNSLAATDVAFAHGGYARRRHALLDGGVTLHELRPTAWSRAAAVNGAFGNAGARASLHSKAQILDDQEVFIGSFNIDPRSANINTELGVFIADARIVGQVQALYRASTNPALAYRVERSDAGLLQWVDDTGEVHALEPKAGFWRRIVAWVARILPVESQL